MKLSVAIPCWSMNGAGKDMLLYNLQILKKQTLKDFQVVVTDHSIDNNIEELCYEWKNFLNIKYLRNAEHIGSPSHNTSLGIKHSDGEYIKLLCQDDFLIDEHSLNIIYEEIKQCNKEWMFTAYYHSNDRVNYYRKYVPYLNNQLYIINTLGTPSALTIKNGNIPEMDINLKYMYDCDFYYRMLLLKGSPHIIDNITMVNYLHENQTTNAIINNEISSKESEYLRRKYC